MWDPYVDGPLEDMQKAHRLDGRPLLYFIGTKHSVFLGTKYEKGSVILDPWRYIPDVPGVEVIRIGG